MRKNSDTIHTVLNTVIIAQYGHKLQYLQRCETALQKAWDSIVPHGVGWEGEEPRPAALLNSEDLLLLFLVFRHQGFTEAERRWDEYYFRLHHRRTHLRESFFAASVSNPVPTPVAAPVSAPAPSAVGSSVYVYKRTQKDV